ncbi:MAG: tetratricopeptide repeat protein [Thermoleophilaceae bacterium]
MSDRWAVARLDDLEALPGPGTLTWRPVRAHFDIRAFGTNAYTAEQAGEDVVEPHDEDGNPGHEELYFVARGRARFTLDGDVFEAAEGTYVFVRDPKVHRQAQALEPGTTVLSFGGPPVFEPSAWEWGFRAGAAESPERAREILDEGFARHPDSAGLHYRVARVEARAGNTAAALEALRRAIEAAPDLAVDARADDALAGLREEPDFQALTGG